jgi:GNAT superfamily N-acetyltransferase
MQLKTALISVEDFYRRIYWEAPAATTQSGPGYTLSYSGINWLHSLNQLWLHEFGVLNAELLDVAAEFFTRFDAEYSIIFGNPDHEKVQRLAQWNLVERANSPIYVLRGLPRPRFAHREAEIVRVSPQEQDDLLGVLYKAFFMGPEVGRCIVRSEHFSDPTVRHYLAYVEGEPAACATIMLNQSMAGVWNVGTLRTYRRQGLASAILMQALVEASQDGYPDSVLIASPMGRPLYEEMGYRFVGELLYYGNMD